MKKWLGIVAAIACFTVLAVGCGSAKESAWVVEPTVECDEIRELAGNENVCILVRDGKLGLIDYTGKVRLEPAYSTIYQCICGENGDNIAVDGYVLNQNYQIAGEHPGHGFEQEHLAWDRDARKAICISYSEIYPFTEQEDADRLYVVPEVVVKDSPYGGQMAENTGNFGYLDAKGSLVIPCVYEEAYEFSGGLARVNKDDSYGYVLEDGTLSIPCEYENAYDFSGGYAPVCKDGKWVYINTAGSVVIDAELTGALPVVGGKAWVCQNGKWGVLDIAASAVK